MTAIALKTELDVAELLLGKGWLPEEINSILVFPLPEAVFRSLLPGNQHFCKGDVLKATSTSPKALYRARQLLLTAGWLDQELNSLLKPCLHIVDPWLNQKLHTPEQPDQPPLTGPRHWLETSTPTVSLQQYRRTMAMKRIGSLGFIITGVCLAVMLTGK